MRSVEALPVIVTGKAQKFVMHEAIDDERIGLMGPGRRTDLQSTFAGANAVDPHPPSIRSVKKAPGCALSNRHRGVGQSRCSPSG